MSDKKCVSVLVPSDILEEIDQQAKAVNLTRSDIINLRLQGKAIVDDASRTR